MKFLTVSQVQTSLRVDNTTVVLSTCRLAFSMFSLITVTTDVLSFQPLISESQNKN